MATVTFDARFVLVLLFDNHHISRPYRRYSSHAPILECSRTPKSSSYTPKPYHSRARQSSVQRGLAIFPPRHSRTRDPYTKATRSGRHGQKLGASPVRRGQSQRTKKLNGRSCGQITI
ncbi:uncharacterized protein BKA55DRAFT_580689 [Fusarium redolens]|uniref:Uncharacterized protein n=1 Tax=Fusarium redolens TaxID=48865 RepID=A0A9P9G6K0_FUSRE|nr:uncharacterized protein BKA55DRAFT_580689 [Fusarium redolens]KAH7234010.1 hypothetical protein BKA55DRAFT_580689 [Fusarium redolens]